jgi:uncharacterized protein with von Willebrand factor type A (vWA) domain
VSRFAYSRWDGTQVGFDLDADALLEEMTDDLLYHGDLNAALRSMMQQGFQDREGRDVAGMREMLERLRERRREQLDRYDLGGVYEDIANRLDEIVDEERAGIDRRVDEAQQSGDKRREELLDELAQERRMELDQLPPDLAGKVTTKTVVVTAASATSAGISGRAGDRTFLAGFRNQQRVAGHHASTAEPKRRARDGGR